MRSRKVWRSPKGIRWNATAKTGRFTPPVLEIHWNTPVYRDGYLYAFSGRNEGETQFSLCGIQNRRRLMWGTHRALAGTPPPGSNAQPGHPPAERGSAPPHKVYGRGSNDPGRWQIDCAGRGWIARHVQTERNNMEEFARYQLPFDLASSVLGRSSASLIKGFIFAARTGWCASISRSDLCA